jgi:hypothetical protein
VSNLSKKESKGQEKEEIMGNAVRWCAWNHRSRSGRGIGVGMAQCRVVLGVLREGRLPLSVLVHYTCSAVCSLTALR